MSKPLSDEEFGELKDGRWWHQDPYNGDVDAHVCPDDAERIDRLIATIELQKSDKELGASLVCKIKELQEENARLMAIIQGLKR